MKKIILFVLVAPVLFCCRVMAQDGLPASEFEKRINTEHPQLLDVRTAGEFQSGHLKNSLQADWLNKDQFADRVQYLDKTKPVLVYCASGVRSAAAARWLADKGFTDVQNLKGGLISWKQEGKPVEAVTNIAQMSVSSYNDLVRSADVVLVDFGAEWCPPCKKMEPVLQQLQTEMGAQFKLVKVDGGNDVDVMKAQKAEALPVFIIYKNGKETWRKQGVTSFSDLKSHLNK